MARRLRTVKSQKQAQTPQVIPATKTTKTTKTTNKQARTSAPTSDGALSRRKLMTGGAIGIATLGIATGSMGNLASLGLLSPQVAHAAPVAAKTTAPRAALHAPLMLYILDAAGDEVRLLYGEKEVVIHDAALVARLANAAQ